MRDREGAVLRDTAGSVGNLLLAGVVASALAANGVLLAGGRLSPVPLAWGVLLSLGLSLAVSVRQAVRLTLVYVLLFGGAALLLTYAQSDSLSCHCPMQRLLMHGWNPVYGTGADAITALAGGQGLAVDHVRFMPRFPAVVGAMTAQLLGSFTGDSFLGLALMFALTQVAFRFGAVFFRSRILAFALAAVAVCTPKLTAILAGYLDYSVYASLLISVFSGALYRLQARSRDLVSFALGSVICFSVKPSGVLFVLTWFAVMTLLLFRDRRYWIAVGIACLALLVLNWSPYVTTWLSWGSPFPPVELTEDFTGNAAALGMNHAERILYAWVSPALACSFSAARRGIPVCAPVFDVFGGVGGLGGGFRLALGVSVLCLAVSRKNIVSLVCVFLFVSANLLPLKFIGYARYVPQMHLLPFLAVFNLVANGYGVAACPGWIRAVARTILAATCCGFAFLVLLRTAAYQRRNVAFEEARFTCVREMAERGGRWSLPRIVQAYGLAERMRVTGVEVSPPGEGECAYVSGTYFVPATSDAAEKGLSELDERYPLCNSVRDLLRFPWFARSERPVVDRFARPLVE